MEAMPMTREMCRARARSVRRARTRALNEPPRLTVGEEVFNAVTHGVGALLAAYVSRITETNGAFKANISVVFLAENVFRFALYAALGILNQAALVTAVKLMPFMLVSLFAGIAVSKKIDDRRIRKLVLLLLVVSGAMLIAQNL